MRRTWFGLDARSLADCHETAHERRNVDRANKREAAHDSSRSYDHIAVPIGSDDDGMRCDRVARSGDGLGTAWKREF